MTQTFLLSYSEDMSSKPSHYLTISLFSLAMLLYPFADSQLDCDFYTWSCPKVHRIVKLGVRVALRNDPRMAASLLRLHFHDCFVNSGGDPWPILLGRQDGLTASEKAANEQLPSPFEPLENITARFLSKGLNLKDVEVLSGAHTIGKAQCFTFKSRLFNLNGSGKPDPALDTSLLSNLISTCPNVDGSNSELATLDSSTPSVFDNVYYKNLVSHSGLLEFDQALMGNPRTAPMVNSYSIQPSLFSKDFGESMVKMGNIGVLTGQVGEIRKKCGYVNIN